MVAKARHGQSGNPRAGVPATPTYRCWSSMVARCDNPEHPYWHRYGGRGIAVDPHWRMFENFYADMGGKPARLSLDRRDNDKGYSKANCRWATSKEQGRNNSLAKLATINGKTQSVRDWCDQLGLAWETVRSRVRKKGLTYEAALTYPRRPRVS